MLKENTEVLIVGGGVVGLSTALFLRSGGVDTVLVERHPDTSVLPKGRNLNSRTMEIYRAHGIEEAIRTAPSSVFEDFPERARAVTLAGRELFREMRPPPEALAGISPTPAALMDQSTVEPIVRRYARQRGADVRFGVQLLSYAQDDGVTAHVVDLGTGIESQVRARYLVAADGHRSAVRGDLGIGREVLSPAAHVMSIVFKADLSEALRGRRIALCYLDEPEPNTLLTPLDRSGRWLLIVPYHPERGDRVDDFTAERCLRLIRAAVGLPDLPAAVVPAIPGSPRLAHPWEMTAWVAERYRAGRVFLVGDACHVMPPTGGLGANTGIQDGHNLAWKLAAVCRGRAGTGLLDTYEVERRPAARLACDFATGRQRDRAAGRSDDEGPLDALAAAMGYRYRSGAVLADGPDDGERARHPRRITGEPGMRAPHLELVRAGRTLSTVDLFRDRFVLLTADEAWAGAGAVLPDVDVVRFGRQVREVAGSWPAAFGVGPGGAVLVRPDGFVCWRSRSGPPDGRASTAFEHLEPVLDLLLAR